MKKIIKKIQVVFTLSLCAIPFIVFAVSNFVENLTIEKSFDNIQLSKINWAIEADIQKQLKKEYETKIKESVERQRVIHEMAENSREILRQFCVNNESEKCKDIGLEFVDEIFFTSYNPKVAQTDNSPCIAGGTNVNICEKYKKGERPIALSQEFLSWGLYQGDYNSKTFKAGEKVYLQSTDYPDDGRCNGEFVVYDAMNPRFVGGDKNNNMKRRGDIFFMNEKDNTSCNAKIFKIL